MKQKVVVIGHGYTSRLGVTRALGKAGYEVVVVVMTGCNKDSTLNTTKPIDCYSKYVSEVHYCLSDKEKLITLLLEKCTDPNQKVVLFTDSDFSEAAVDENQERLRDHFLFPHIKHQPGAVVAWMDKVRQKETARSVGLNVAEGWLIDVTNGEYTIPEEIKYPCFPKPLATIVGGKGGLRKCNTKEDLKSVVASMIQKKPTISILVEEYKEIETEHALLGFTDGKNVIIPGIIQTMSLANGGHFGVAKQGKIMPTTGFEDLVERFKQFVLQTEFVGIFDIDFYKSEGRYYFCEMNFRYGGSGYACTAMGVNLPVMLVKTLRGESISNMKANVSEKAVFVNERMCIDDWYGGYISTNDYKSLLKNADISFVYDVEDKAPQCQLEKLYIKRLIKKSVKSILGRLINH